MWSESFYSTIAQVLPALLIPLALEVVALRRSVIRSAWLALYSPDDPTSDSATRSSQPIPHSEVDMESRHRRALALGTGIILVGVFVCLAEMCAVLMLLVGTDNWFPIVAGPFCALTVVALTILVVWMLLARIVRTWAQPEA
jgi:hypothetical protein